MTRSVVVALDFLPHSERALALALRGYPFGAEDVELDILHVLDKDADAAEELAARAAINALIDKLITRLGISAALRTKISVLRGGVVACIIAHVLESRAFALMLGGQPHRAMGERLIGNTALSVLRGSKLPTYVVKETTQDLDKRSVICAVNFDPQAKEALLMASHVAEGSGRALTLVHVMDNELQYPTAAAFEGEGRIKAEDDLTRFEMETLGRSRPRDHKVVFGPTANAIVETVSDVKAGLVVTGSHCFGWVGRALSGSVGEKVASHSPVDVLVVR